MEKKLIYRPLPKFSEDEYKRIMENGDIEELIVLPLSAGENCPDWKTAQDICLRLAEYPDERVKANAALGLAYTARTKGRLEKHIVKPVLLKLLKECTEEGGKVADAIEDVNRYMKE
jgi:hypothetical protein